MQPVEWIRSRASRTVSSSRLRSRRSFAVFRKARACRRSAGCARRARRAASSSSANLPARLDRLDQDRLDLRAQAFRLRSAKTIWILRRHCGLLQGCARQLSRRWKPWCARAARNPGSLMRCPFSFSATIERISSRDFAVGRAAAQEEFQIVVFLAEKAGPQFPVGRQPDARTMSAKRLRNRERSVRFRRGHRRSGICAPFRCARATTGTSGQRAEMRLMHFRAGDDHVARPRRGRRRAA